MGDSALLIRFGEQDDRDMRRRVRATAAHLDAHPVQGLVEIVPGVTTITVHFDPLADQARFLSELQSTCAGLEFTAGSDLIREVGRFEIPVLYGGEYGPDLEMLAARTGLTPEETVERHCGAEYTVEMLGFLPGFPYLGGLPDSLATPRRDSPRLSVPAGSVGIAGTRTGIYPIESPGGWNIIGRTPTRLFLPDCDPPVLLIPGDVVRFTPIDRRRFEAIEREGRR